MKKAALVGLALLGLLFLATTSLYCDDVYDTIPMRHVSPHEPLHKYGNSRFFPLGWSRDGKFAYIVENYEDAVGVGPIYSWRIVDTVTDEIVWRKGLQYDAWEEEYYEFQTNQRLAEEQIEYFEYAFSKRIAEYRSDLEGYGIVYDPNIEFMAFPYETAGMQYNASIVDITEGFVHIADFITGYRVVVERSIGDSKTVKHEKETAILGVKVAGLFVSPFEKRICIVLFETWRGFEGPPNPSNLVLVGSHLEYGYK